MAYREWNWDIDRHLNRFIPPPPWHLIPYPLDRFLGHRPDKSPPPSTGNIMVMLWAFFGILLTIALIEGAVMSVPSFVANDGPIIVGSLGASAVLEFLVIDSPLAQPRNAVGGHVIATIVGVAISKLFQLNDNFRDIRWLGGAFACAAATVIMALTKTVHPPAGATALTAVVDTKLVALGWLLVPAVMVGSLLMLGMSLVVNNIDRRFPLYWWTAADLASDRHEAAEKGVSESESISNDKPPGTQRGESRWMAERIKLPEGTRSHLLHDLQLIVRPGEIILPRGIVLTEAEERMLRSISQRLGDL
ncbi:hypothetical protein L249_7151 [Ophiocordyceps polyrhachis-furcata BCC 54312]|uniref:HPP transmembrane region domain-containing protein n=1 Tax=Ophiocordyceps polyrhachis-furcata BCC 54312 TaxID=1330021 RepID=A0A367LBQ0_9HYPO|nr:hypothetical protein L249_7151 [Ophiocordyceps polyrhachis-furcata BCC 54312]